MLDSAQLSSLGKARRINVTKDDTRASCPEAEWC
jgi:hypothetical protein